MNWKNRIRQPSFRGVPFEVEGDEMEGGRRVVTHEYPQRDTSDSEDLGLKAKTYSLTVFQVGKDYMSWRDKLIQACDEPGPGLLVHPQFGSIDVNCTGYRVTHTAGKLGLVGFQLRFIISGKAVNPGSAIRTSDVLFDKAGQASDSAIDLLDSRFSLSSVPSFVSESSHAAFVRTAELVGFTRSAVVDPVAFAKTLAGLSSVTPAELATMQPGTALGRLFREAEFSMIGDMPNPTGRMAEMLAVSKGSAVAVLPSFATASRLQEAENLNGLGDFLRQMGVAEAARAASGVTPETARDAVRMTRDITAAIDDVLETTTDDSIFTTFTDLRVAAVRDLSIRARQAKQIREFTPTMTGPALVAAHRACDRGAQETDEMVRRNRVRHPGFVGVLPLEVLVDA
ncbi:MAG: DNA circularization N-terminal domain-containing protein [Pseudodesulfovibrio sp.]|nr:DNA circularization N-terminal domain-containing protein [Pseudodesulfovibrio sp.]